MLANGMVQLLVTDGGFHAGTPASQGHVPQATVFVAASPFPPFRDNMCKLSRLIGIKITLAELVRLDFNNLR